MRGGCPYKHTYIHIYIERETYINNTFAHTHIYNDGRLIFNCVSMYRRMYLLVSLTMSQYYCSQTSCESCVYVSLYNRHKFRHPVSRSPRICPCPGKATGVRREEFVPMTGSLHGPDFMGSKDTRITYLGLGQ